ncbi:hypothetical protein, partial [Chlorobium sp.]|uniref:hypothetical protein n=1 Tax=Chlorobium sp. TaxID=1095 RepID=UPI003C3CB9C3
PEETGKQEIQLEHGTIAKVTRILAEKCGEKLTINAVSKRIHRQSDPATIRLAFRVSARIKSERASRKQEEKKRKEAYKQLQIEAKAAREREIDSLETEANQPES